MMLEIVAEFGRERMASNEIAAAHQAHAMYFAAFVEELRPRIDGPDQVSIIARLEPNKTTSGQRSAGQSSSETRRRTAAHCKLMEGLACARALSRRSRLAERSLAMTGDVTRQDNRRPLRGRVVRAAAG